MNRPQLFSRALAIMFRSGSLWLVALPVAAVNLALSLVLAGGTFIEITARLLLSVVTAAFLTGALISLVNAIAEGQAVSANDGFAAGARTFVPLLIIGLILAIPSWVMGQILDAFFSPLLLSFQQEVNSADPNAISSTMAQAGVLLCCMLPLVVLVSALVALVTGAIGVGAERGVALEDQGVGAALKRGWGLMLGRLSDFLVIGLLMLAILAGIGILFGCPALVIVFITTGMATAVSEVSASMSSYTTILSIFFAVLSLPLTILFSGVWTLAFRHWQGKDAAVPAPVLFPPVPPVPPEFPGT